MAFINAYIVYKELHGDHSHSVLEFRRNVSRGLLTIAKPINPKRGRPSMSPNTSSPTANQSKKRRGVAASVADDVRFHNLGVHWPEYGRERGRIEICALAKLQSRPHCRCSTCKGFLCCNEKKCFRAYHAQWVGVKYATEHGRWELCLLAKVQSRPHFLAQHVSSLSAAKEGNGSRAYTMQSKRLKGCKYIVLVSTTK